MVWALLAIWGSQVKSPPEVVSSYDLLRGTAQKSIPSISKRHHWLTFGKWDQTSTNDFQRGAAQIAIERNKDLEGVLLRRSLIATWKSQLDHSANPSLINNLKDLVKALPEKSFPGITAPTGKWFRFSADDVSQFDRAVHPMVEKVTTSISQKYQDTDIRSYLLLRKISGRLMVYLASYSAEGKHLGLDQFRLEDFDPKAINPTGYEPWFAGKTPRPVQPKELGGTSLNPVSFKELPITEIVKVGFHQWVHDRVAVAAKDRRPVAVMGNDGDLTMFLKQGGTLEAFLQSHGYQAFDVGAVTLVLPPNFEDAEKLQFCEQEIASIKASDPPATVLRAYATWVKNSGFGGSYDLMSYVFGCLSWQQNLPNVADPFYPLVPLLALCPNLTNDQPSLVNLSGAQLGAQGDQLCHDRLEPSFLLGARLSDEQRLGYFWGAGGIDQLTSISFSVGEGERVQMKSLRAAPLAVEDFASQLGMFGDTWEAILETGGNNPVALLSGTEVNITIHSRLGRVCTGKVFFPKTSKQSIKFRDLPPSMLKEIRQATLDLFEDFKKDSGTPPPFNAWEKVPAVQ